MARILVFDAGPLGIACHTPRKSSALMRWATIARANGAMLFIPGIADYEVRRALIEEREVASINRLDMLQKSWAYIPITQSILNHAAELWALARLAGLPIGDSKALGADAIVAAQALSISGLNDRMTVVTSDVNDLSRFVHAAQWESLTP